MSIKNNKIAIITEFSFNTVNYGNHLQAYALNKYLRDEFPSYEINTIILKNKTGRKFISFHVFIEMCISKLKIILAKKNKSKIETTVRLEMFQKFALENIKLSKYIYSYKELKRSDYKVFIVGSDVVWFQTKGVIYKPKFLAFSKRRETLKIAYAASFGKNDIPTINRKYIKKYLEDFDCISVRESKAVEILKQLGIRDVENVCDPTMLISKEQWDAMALPPLKIDNNYIKGYRSYVFAYILGESEKQIKKIKKLCLDNHIDLLYIPFIKGQMDSSLTKDMRLIDCSPQEWIWLIKNAEYVITDSFHGMIFSAIFERKFFVIERNDKEDINDRLYDFLKLIGAEDKFADINTMLVFDNYSWDYSIYNKKISELKKDSEKYIEEIIKGLLWRD